MRSIVTATCAIGMFVLATFGFAADPPKDSPEKPADAALREKWQKVYREIAESLEMRHDKTKLLLHDAPLLYYSNPVRGTDQHGTMFLWTEEGRPAVLGSVWSGMDRQKPTLRNITHEFHSLVEDSKIESLVDGKTRWTSGERGIAWQALAGTPAPEATRTGRLVQMRVIARRLSASITAEEKNELRLLPQPLYRYPDKTAGAVDGAVFVFALATDPELVLLIEASADADTRVWKVAFARFGNLAMAVKDGERTLWTCERGTPGRSAGKYYLYWRVEQRPAELENSPAAK